MEATAADIFLQRVLGAIWPGAQTIPAWLGYSVLLLLGAALIIGWMSLLALAWTYGERRIAGLIQVRLGPNRVGPQGILQPLADGIKLLVKEDVVPAVAYRFIYTLAPLIVFVGALLPFIVLPFSERLVISNIELGLYFVLAFEAIEVIGVLMAGWAPGSKWSLYGGMRLAAQMLSYEIPMGLCALVIIILTGSVNLGEIVAWQSRDAWFMEHPWIFGWAIFRSPAALLAFVMFYVGGLAATKRAPFDLPEAESELVAGYHTEYSGMRFAFFFMAEYASMYVICALATILFLGGWHAPIPRPELAADASLMEIWSRLAAAHGAAGTGVAGKFGAFGGSLIALLTDPGALKILLHQTFGVVNLLLKTFLLYFVMIWVRWTLPRLRIDQVMYLCLKVFLPFSVACVVWALIQVVMLG